MYPAYGLQPEEFKNQETFVAGQRIGHYRKRPNQSRLFKLVGSASEVDASIEGNLVRALINTVSNDFYTKHLRHLELHPIKELLQVTI